MRRRLPHYEVLRAWSEYAHGSDLSSSTIETYRAYLERFSSHQMVDLLEAGTEHISAFLASRGEHGPAKAQARRAFRHFYRWAVLVARLRPDDPTAPLPKIRQRRRAPAYLTYEEVGRLCLTTYCHSPEWAWIFAFIFAAGLRVGEACALKIADVDLWARTFIVRDPKNGEDREQPLEGTALRAVLELIDGKETLLGVTPGAVRDRMHKFGRLAGIPKRKRHPHALRHACGTRLSELGASEDVIMAHLGHKDPKMAQWYRHVTSPRRRATSALL